MTTPINRRSEALLGRGYFPKELPPPFQTRSLAEKAKSLRPKWAALRAGLTSRERDSHPRPSHPVLFDMARRGHARRTLSMPNPVNQFYLTEELSRHWSAITKLINRSKLSVTRCDIAPEGRAIPVPPMSTLDEKRVVAYAAQGAILQTDVLSFYHSIYTHAISWALHGKSVAKANRRARDSRFFGNRIDELVRSCQDGQTVGIPVGPDTSRIISEMMLCAVEAQIPKQVRRLVQSGFRYIDDFFLCFASLAEADATLAALREACLHFDLQLNAAKTRTILATAFNEETWPSELSAIPIAPSGKMQRRSLIRFFSMVIDLSKRLPDESIATYAVRMTSKAAIAEENWDLYEAFLLRMVRENSNCVDSVVKILCTYAALGYTISPSVTAFIERFIADHAPYNHHFEVAWVLWLARSLGIRLSRKASSLVAQIENDVCAVLAMELRSRKLLTGRDEVAGWLGPVQADQLYGSHWLVIYEAASRSNWRISGAEAAVAANPFFAAMASEGISFFDSGAVNRPLKFASLQLRVRRLRRAAGRIKQLGTNAEAHGNVSMNVEYEELGGQYEGAGFFRWSSNEEEEEEI